jgi:hypothetical protein
MAEPAEGAAHGVKAAGKGLGKNVGPLPLGVWVAVILGGLGVAYFINRSRGAAPAAESSGDFGSATSGTGTGGTSTWSANLPPGSSTTPAISTNVQWEQAASRYLLALGADPILVDNAMRKYLFNQPLSISEKAVIAAAVSQFGLPPEPLPPTDEPPPGGGGGTTDPPPDGGGTTGAVPSLSATPIGNGQVRVDWTYTGTDVATWTIGRDGSDTLGSDAWAKDGLPLGTTTWTFNSLKGGTPYTFTLTGHKSTGGDIASVHTSATPTGGQTGSGNGQQNQQTPPTPPPDTHTDPPPPAPSPSVTHYTVVSGDNLWNISKHFYGNGVFWTRIYNANRDQISNPNLIYPGQVFVIP